MLNSVADINKLFEMKGGKEIKISNKKLLMREFIYKLIKTFRKDFMKKMKKGGDVDAYPTQQAFIYGDLNFKPYEFVPYTTLERDLL